MVQQQHVPDGKKADYMYLQAEDVMDMVAWLSAIRRDRNTTWALVTMGDASSLDKVMDAHEQTPLHAGVNPLVLKRFHAGVAEKAVKKSWNIASSVKSLIDMAGPWNSPGGATMAPEPQPAPTVAAEVDCKSTSNLPLLIISRHILTDCL